MTAFDKGGVQALTWYDMNAAAIDKYSMLGELSEQKVEFLGVEEMTTPAGTFAVDHWRTGSVDYYTTGPDRIMVKFVWSGAGNEYVLVEFKQN